MKESRLSNAGAMLGHGDALLSSAEVMAMLGLSDPRSARRFMVAAGGFKLGRDYRVRRSRLEHWLELCEAETEVRSASHRGSRQRREDWIEADSTPNDNTSWRLRMHRMAG